MRGIKLIWTIALLWLAALAIAVQVAHVQTANRKVADDAVQATRLQEHEVEEQGVKAREAKAQEEAEREKLRSESQPSPVSLPKLSGKPTTVDCDTDGPGSMRLGDGRTLRVGIVPVALPDKQWSSTGLYVVLVAKEPRVDGGGENTLKSV